MFKVLKPWTIFDVQWFKWVVVAIYEVKELFILYVWCLKHHFPFINKVITFSFPAKVPREFTREHWDWFERFGFYINDFVRIPVTMTRAFPKFDVVLLVMREKCLKIFQNGNWMFLEEMIRQVKIFFHHVDWVYNNNDFGDIIIISCLVDTISNCKEFGFSTCDI